MAEVVNGAETNVAIIEGLPSEHTTARMGGFSRSTPTSMLSRLRAATGSVKRA